MFGIVLAAHASLYAWLILDRRMPREHDAQYSYVLQYIFQCLGTEGGDPALWLPMCTHGRVSNWEFVVHSGLVQTLVLGCGGLPEGWNYVPWFLATLWFDELVLIVGVWCLGKRYGFSPQALFLTTLTAAASSIGFDQIQFNLRLVYPLPLVFALFHGFVDEGTRWKLHAVLSLLLIQFMGNTPYGGVLVVCVAVLYFVTYAMLFKGDCPSLLRNLRPRVRDMPGLMVHLAALVSIYVLLIRGTENLVLHREGRAAGGNVDLDGFLTAGSALNPLKFLDLLAGLSPCLDYSLYVGQGILALAAVAAFCRPGKRALHLGVCAILLVLFSAGYLSLVSALSYYAVPPLRFYRHVALVAPLVKLFLILLSGAGLDLWIKGAVAPRLACRIGWGWVAAGALLASLAAATASRKDLALRIAEVVRTARFSLGESGDAQRWEFVVPALGAAALAALGVGFLLRRPSALVVPFLLLQVADVHRWKIQMLQTRTVPLDVAQYALQEIRPLPFRARRDVDAGATERYAALVGLFPDRSGAPDYVDSYLHLDPPLTRGVTTHWEKPFDLLLRGGRPPAFEQLIGFREDKLQVFASARRAGSDGELSRLLNDPRFEGDLLLLAPDAQAAPWEGAPLAAGTRLRVAPRVLAAHADVVRVSVDLPAGAREGWLYYADVWHPDWTATVNGTPARVERAWLAYKAVRLVPGGNVVEFRFRAPARALSFRLMWVLAGAWFVGILGAAARILLPRRLREDVLPGVSK